MYSFVKTILLHAQRIISYFNMHAKLKYLFWKLINHYLIVKTVINLTFKSTLKIVHQQPCFTLTGIIQKLLSFDKFPFYALTEKRLVNSCMCSISHLDLTIRRCDDAKLTFEITCAVKKVPPAVYVHVRTFCTF